MPLRPMMCPCTITVTDGPDEDEPPPAAAADEEDDESAALPPCPDAPPPAAPACFGATARPAIADATPTVPKMAAASNAAAAPEKSHSARHRKPRAVA
jgi:hypothetical protein